MQAGIARGRSAPRRMHGRNYHGNNPRVDALAQVGRLQGVTEMRATSGSCLPIAVQCLGPAMDLIFEFSMDMDLDGL